MSERVRTLIVDDSASMRAALNRILSADPAIEVVGLAPEPHAARAMIKELSPDVITLDVEMPGMDGLSFLEKIMRLRPMPVVMCSTLTARGAEVTIEALRLGAVDCVAKPSGNPLEIVRDAELLCATVKAAARSAVRPLARQASAARDIRPAGAGTREMVIAIGASTGGVEALFALLAALPEDCPPVLVVQHMPAAFTGSFAARLDRECRAKVVEAVDGQPIGRGTVYIAPGGEQHMELAGGIAGRIKLRRGDPITGHRPSVDMLFRSVAPLGKAAVGVILTGMGTDGAEGMLAMREAGARTLGQSRESCVVYGMPRAAFELGAVEKELSLSAMPEAILAACRK
ncbi:protein-glutamate methylesterase/protein-glutamine glutaminase [Sphingomonas mucosissima]|uniref:Protein-glutamate methylesterase/protein-glutamine glutaminase n=1 Tax=Sphingomonas mucosissima TaxID=370959 RepID=A0A245ZTN5_9SPHN|nr:chemotaxis response regulator protein-glutamate methylesterase [Sphingomonas mucosissima]OWK33096.1 chemotaxis response regulator protein-glutamate methylesterase [Sphingomonas mucosissima]